MTGKFIVIEGSDGAGKQTQADLAVAALKQHGEVAYFDFPQYSRSIAGGIVGRALKGEYGDFVELHPHLASLPYTVDRASARRELVKSLERGTVVCNRYTPSNSAHQGAKYKTTEEQDEFVELLEKLEYDELGLPKPDLVIYLHVPFDFSQKLMAEKTANRDYLSGQKGDRDQHEKNEQYQRAVISFYLRMAQTRRDWCSIECIQEGTLASREKIHEMVMKEIRSLRQP